VKHKSFPKPKICMKDNEIPIWAKHSAEDISSKGTGYTSKPFAQHSRKNENTGTGHTYLGKEDLQPAKQSRNGTPATEI